MYILHLLYAVVAIMSLTHNAKRCFSVRMRNAATSLFIWEVKQHQTVRNGRQTWTQYEPQSDSRSLQVA
ncbi:Efflux pump atB [Fusarium oxysporum f. sp. albedinis]|nr:Efflux pump atB [Fusarium oxysporum f. sp. albedinis]